LWATIWIFAADILVYKIAVILWPTQFYFIANFPQFRKKIAGAFFPGVLQGVYGVKIARFGKVENIFKVGT
jgi:hypothetical protein